MKVTYLNHLFSIDLLKFRDLDAVWAFLAGDMLQQCLYSIAHRVPRPRRNSQTKLEETTKMKTLVQRFTATSQ